MSQTASASSHLSLVPLGAGDLIDRAVRFYRGNFWTFVLIAAPPVIVGTVISVAWTFLARSLFSVGSDTGVVLGFYYIFLWLGSLVIWFTQTVAVLSVMGGASRNFVRHLLFSEPLSFKQTYENTWHRLGGLIVASSIITVIVGIAWLAAFNIGGMIGGMLIIFAYAALQMIPPLAILVCIILGIGIVIGTGWLFFLIVSRFAYVPQVMLVEGQGVVASIGRSVALASGNIKRIAALFVFTTAATYAALALFYIPLLWVAWWNGIEFFTFESTVTPAWYEIASQLVWQASFILLTPVLMVGLCLLYVDERVRFEGYDIELMAARRLGDIPSVPQAYVNPLQPALADRRIPESSSSRETSSITTLGLK